MQMVYDFLKQCGTYYLATICKDQPKVRPFGTIDIFDGRLYIQTGKSKQVSAQMKANPEIEICATLGEDQWLRVSAKAVYDNNIEAQKHLLDNYPELHPMYQPGDGETEVFYLKDATATFYSFTDSPKIVKF